ncbi:hypothetical protein K438DRAFT_1764702 [Mycena galopus ATCC 62051]|nr:hypothetical protein K438DRAFT_1764702 [Mycena galopus ATCC 62051]
MEKVSDTYKPIQNLESKQLMFKLARSPAKYCKYLDRYTNSVAVVVTYGCRVHDIYKDEVRIFYDIWPSIPGKYGLTVYRIVENLRTTTINRLVRTPSETYSMPSSPEWVICRHQTAHVID